MRGWQTAERMGPVDWTNPEWFPRFLWIFAELLHYMHKDSRLPSPVDDLPEKLRSFDGNFGVVHFRQADGQ